VITLYGYIQYGNIPINSFLELGIRITTVEKENIDRLKIKERKLKEMVYEVGPG
jgi:hypothetical protein